MRIDNLIHRFLMASIAAYDSENCQHPQWGFEALKWYVETDRASLDFMAACEALSKRRMITLLRKASLCCIDDAINAAKRYLKVA